MNRGYAEFLLFLFPVAAAAHPAAAWWYNPCLMADARTQSSIQAHRGSPRWLWLIYAALLFGFIGLGAGIGILLGYEYNLPRVQSLEDFRPDVISNVYSDDEKVIGEFAIERRIIVGFDEIPSYLHLALLAAEDDQFYYHSGMDYFSVPR
ncbi:MAG: hypothetical protein FJW35_12190, partial [Acidobacteria bacterium]|nr:hypothetical protein [Acidobacteriota bacterium]